MSDNNASPEGDEPGVGSAIDLVNRDGPVDSSRRKFMLAGAATWASISLAGCTDLLSNEEEPEETVPHFVVTDEVFAGSAGIPEGAEGFFVPGQPLRAFIPGMQAVFKIGVWDPETGAIVSDVALDEVLVDLDRAEEIELIFARNDREWTGDWNIPEDEETGTVTYEVSVTNAAEFTQVGIAENELEIVDFQPLFTSYVVTDDTYATETRAGGYVQSCLPQHNFSSDMAIGFDIGIYDGSTGDPVGPDTVDEVVIEFEVGEPSTMELEWDEDDELWNNVWRGTPDDFTGTLTYEVQVTNEAEFNQVGVYQGSVEIIDAAADPTATYVVTDDTYSTETRADGFVQSCLPQHTFTPEMPVGFDIGIYDGSTGDPVGPDTVDEVVIEFEVGDPSTMELEWDEDDELWNNVWRGIPDDFTGTLTYEVQVTNAGEFYRVGVYQGSFQVIEEP